MLKGSDHLAGSNTSYHIIQREQLRSLGCTETALKLML